MKRTFLKPFALTVTALLATSSLVPEAGASVNSVPLTGVNQIAEQPQPQDLVIELPSANQTQLAGHSSHVSHASHASHCSGYSYC
jgi:hypothetical protein